MTVVTMLLLPLSLFYPLIHLIYPVSMFVRTVRCILGLHIVCPLCHSKKVLARDDTGDFKVLGDDNQVAQALRAEHAACKSAIADCQHNV